MLSLIKDLSTRGVNTASALAHKRKILHCNVAALIGFCTVTTFCVIYVVTGDPLLINIAKFEVPLFPFYLSPIWLNGKGNHVLASWVLIITSMISVIISVVAGLGTEFNVQLYFILFAVGPISIFTYKHWRSVLFLFCINVAIYTYYIVNPVPSALSLAMLNPSWKHLITILMSTSVALTTFILFWLSDSVAEKSETEIERMAMLDSLTGLPNRRAFEIAFEQHIANCTRTNEPLAIAMLDIDHFKRINDTYGHDFGDEVLKHVAQIIGSATRAGSFVARIGGEEFVMLLPNLSLTSAAGVAERVRASVQENGHYARAGKFGVTISAGVTLVDVSKPLDCAYKEADTALYRAKECGRNQVALSP